MELDEAGYTGGRDLIACVHGTTHSESSVTKAARPTRFQRKVQNKPISMLKASMDIYTRYEHDN